MATGFLHVVTGVLGQKDVLAAMLDDGLWESARAGTERQFASWFIATGVCFVLTGLAALDRERPLSAAFGWTLAFFGIVGCIVFGGSGFVLIVPQAIYVLVVQYRFNKSSERTRQADQEPADGTS